MKLHGEELHNF